MQDKVKPSVKVITLNWNGYLDTAEFLNSFKKIKYKNYSVTVIDNASLGDDAEKLRSEFGDYADVVRIEENLGFAGGNNFGIKRAIEDNPDYILLINNDTIVEDDFLDLLINEIESDNKIGMISPVIYYYSDPEKIWSAGGEISWLRSSGFSETSIPAGGEPVRRTDFISGCCMLIRKEVLLEIGSFDESFFLYLEDADLCFRAIRKGYKVLTAAKSKIYHKVGSSSKNSVSFLPLYYTTRNRLYFAKKHYPKSFFIQFTYIFITIFIKNLWWLFTGKTILLRTTKRSFFDFFAGRMGKRINNEPLAKEQKK